MRQGEQPDSSSGSEPLWVPGQIRCVRARMGKVEGCGLRVLGSGFLVSGCGVLFLRV
jgi:hypothetical protein